MKGHKAGWFTIYTGIQILGTHVWP